MNGIKWVQLTALVDFMYNGEVNIFQDDLDDFLTVAKELQLKGLQGNETENKEPDQEPNLHQLSVRPRKKSTIAKTNFSTLDTTTLDNLQEYETKVEPDITAIDEHIATYDELDEKIWSMMTRSNGQWSCNLCGKRSKDKTFITFHIETKHIEGASHPCNQCGKFFRFFFTEYL